VAVEPSLSAGGGGVLSGEEVWTGGAAQSNDGDLECSSVMLKLDVPDAG